MKRGVALILLALVALVAQGAAGMVLPAPLVPDLGLLIVIGVALSLRSALAGTLFAALVGYTTDLFSGSLLGQHMLLRMGAFAAARIAAGRLNLRGAPPQMIFTAGLSLAHSAALWLLVAFFSPQVAMPLVPVRDLLVHALVNALLAPVVSQGVAWVVARLGDDESAQRLVLAPRRLGS